MSNTMISNRTNSSSSNSSREVCKYFLHGMCRYGESCYFSHNRNNNNNSNTINSQQQHSTEETNNNNNSNICKYYLQGRCMFGESCYNRHVRPSTNNNTTNSNGAQINSSHDDEDDDDDEDNDDDDDEISYENAAAAAATRRRQDDQVAKTNESTSSSQSSSSSLTSTNSNSNSELVKRSLGANKPKLRLTTISNNNLSVAAKPFEPKTSKSMTSKAAITEENATTTPSSYYEALTGKKLNYDELDLDSSELNMFEPAYAEYLRKKKANFQEEAASAMAEVEATLCPYSELHLACPFDEAGTCEFSRHLLQCDQCQQYALESGNVEQQQAHRADCMRAIEADMEEAFAIAASREKLCGICMEVVWEKEPSSERRFGILESCNHIFCLACIRKWRSSKAYENKVVKACPECRVKSDYVTPSRFWFDNEDAKKKIIDDYKSKLSKTACKYFKQGEGSCPFGNKCFYLHQYKDGRLATNLPEPTRRRRFNRDGRIESYQNLIRIELSLLEDDDTDDFDSFFDYFRNNFLWDSNNDSDSDVSDFFEFNDFLSLF